MKALSLRQPWANAVLYLGKVIENRHWRTSFRGEFLIHAARGMMDAEWSSAVDFCEDVLGVARCFEIEAALGAGDAPTHQRHHGGIVGRARLVDVIPPWRPDGLLTAETFYPRELLDSGAWRWHMREQYGFVLADVRPTPFLACRGMPGFFDVDDDLLETLRVLELQDEIEERSGNIVRSPR